MFDNGQIVRYRLGRAGRSAVEWQDWETGPLYVQKTDDGEICVLTPTAHNWAEYDLRRDMQVSDGVVDLVCEDWYMQIDNNSQDNLALLQAV